jgi:peptide/nickel transport system substrate-binding protein
MSAEWKDVYTPMAELPPAVREIYEYHPDKAKQLLTEAGYPTGFSTEILTYAVYSDRVQIIAGYWAKIGIDCKIRVVETAAYMSEVYGKKYPAVCASAAGLSDPPTTLSYFLSTAYYNYACANFPHYDEVVNKIQVTLDPVERAKLCKEINVWYLENVVSFAFPTQKVTYFWQPWVYNYHGELNLAQYQIGALAARIWLDQDLKKSRGR